MFPKNPTNLEIEIVGYAYTTQFIYSMKCQLGGKTLNSNKPNKNIKIQVKNC